MGEGGGVKEEGEWELALGEGGGGGGLSEGVPACACLLPTHPTPTSGATKLNSIHSTQWCHCNCIPALPRQMNKASVNGLMVIMFQISLPRKNLPPYHFGHYLDRIK